MLPGFDNILFPSIYMLSLTKRIPYLDALIHHISLLLKARISTPSFNDHLRLHSATASLHIFSFNFQVIQFALDKMVLYLSTI